MIKMRDQSLSDEMFARSLALGYKTYDCKPLDNVGYPFVELESTQMVYETNKTGIRGTVIVVLSAWGLQRKQEQVSDMASALLNEARLIEATEGYCWTLNCQANGTQMMDDTTTNTPLKRAATTLKFRTR